MMQAALLSEPNKIIISELPVPNIKEDEVLMKMIYAGICGSDIHIFRGRNKVSTPPVIIGHELVGELAANSTESKKNVGAKYGIFPLESCGECMTCRKGFLNVCENLKILGVNKNGGFAEYVAVNKENLIPYDSQLPNQVAAMLEPFAVGHHANSRGQTLPGKSVLVTGGGMIGIASGLMAEWMGADKVVITDIDQKKINYFEEFNINMKHMDDVKSWNIDKFDVLIESSGAPNMINRCLDYLNPKGTIVCLGFPHELEKIDITKVILNEFQLIGSRVYEKDDFHASAKLLKKNYLKQPELLSSIIEKIIPLHQLEEGILEMENKKNYGKILVHLGKQ